MSYKLGGVLWNDDGTMATEKPTPLEALAFLTSPCVVLTIEQKLEYINIIETAIKNYEELANKPVILYGRTHGHTQSIINYICKNYKEVKITNLEDEKKLKALEIIKNKQVNVAFLIQSTSVDQYNYNIIGDRRALVQEEYDILKEELL